MLSQRERQTLSVIRAYWREKGSAPSLRFIQEELWYSSPRSIQLLVNSLVKQGYLIREEGWKLNLGITDNEGQMTFDIPLLGSVACGAPIYAEENIEAYIPVSTKIATPPYKYFFLRAKWDSMDKKGINDRDLILVREQHTARDGEIVVALIDDEATIKEFKHLWDSIALIPHSNNEKHKPILLQEDFLIQWVFVKSFPASIF